MSPLTKEAQRVAKLSEDVLAQIKALGESTQYRILRSVTLRSQPSKSAAIIKRLEPVVDGAPHLIAARPSVPGWVEVVEDGRTLGYILSGKLRKI